MNPANYHNNFPPKNLQWEQLIPLLGKAHAVIARYDSILEVITNKEILLSPLGTQEAVLSNKIEGTQVTMGEVLQFEAQGENKELSESKKQDISEIINYRMAMESATIGMKKLPICNRIILKAHKELMKGVRGQNKAPGQYRKVDNWIGAKGCTKEQAYYLPPTAMKVPALMSNWEKYINGEEKDPLVQLALLHIEFEAIHPFLDGNGRLGRMLIPLYMFQKKLIKSPSFYISAYLEANRDQYYESLRAVSRDGDWLGWCKFFLTAIEVQANDNLNKAKQIFNLYNRLKTEIPKLTHFAIFYNYIRCNFQKTIFSIK